MTEPNYPQVRITPTRFLNPETTEVLLEKVFAVGGIVAQMFQNVLISGGIQPTAGCRRRSRIFCFGAVFLGV